MALYSANDSARDPWFIKHRCASTYFIGLAPAGFCMYTYIASKTDWHKKKVSFTLACHLPLVGRKSCDLHHVCALHTAWDRIRGFLKLAPRMTTVLLAANFLKTFFLFVCSNNVWINWFFFHLRMKATTALILVIYRLIFLTKLNVQ